MNVCCCPNKIPILVPVEFVSLNAELLESCYSNRCIMFKDAISLMSSANYLQM